MENNNTPKQQYTDADLLELCQLVMDSPKLGKDCRISKEEIAPIFPKRTKSKISIDLSVRCFDGTLHLHKNGDVFLYSEDDELQPIERQLEIAEWLKSKSSPEAGAKADSKTGEKEWWQQMDYNEQELLLQTIVDEINTSSNLHSRHVIRKIIESEIVKTVPGWVRVEDRLPTKMKMYVCKVKVIDEGLTFYPVAYVQFDTIRGEWTNPHVCHTKGQVTEWLDEAPPASKQEGPGKEEIEAIANSLHNDHPVPDDYWYPNKAIKGLRVDSFIMGAEWMQEQFKNKI